MKLPRWLLIGMLTASVLAVLAAAGWWWVTWPERTARDLVELMGQARYEAASRMIKVNPEHPMPFLRGHPDLQQAWNQANLSMDSSSWLDLVSGRRRFRIPRDGPLIVLERNTTRVEILQSFTVERGKVVQVDNAIKLSEP